MKKYQKIAVSILTSSALVSVAGVTAYKCQEYSQQNTTIQISNDVSPLSYGIVNYATINNSRVIVKSPSVADIDTIMDNLFPGSDDKVLLGKLVELNQFPPEATYVINTVTPVDKKNSTVSFTFTPSKIYKNSVVTDNIIALSAAIKFAPLVPPESNNIYIIIALSISGAAIILLIAGLIAWFVRKDHKKKNPKAPVNAPAVSLEESIEDTPEDYWK